MQGGLADMHRLMVFIVGLLPVWVKQTTVLIAGATVPYGLDGGPSPW